MAFLNLQLHSYDSSITECKVACELQARLSSSWRYWQNTSWVRQHFESHRLDSPLLLTLSSHGLMRFMSRSACYGSAESSYDALLPLLTLLPPNLGDNTELMADLLGAVLTGWTASLSAGASASSKAKQSAAACYTECWCYILAKVRLKYIRAIGAHIPLPSKRLWE